MIDHPVLIALAVIGAGVVAAISVVVRQIVRDDTAGWDSTEEQVIEGVVILRAEPVAPQWQEPIEVRRIEPRVSHASPETATGSVAYQGRHHATQPRGVRMEALLRPTETFEVIAALEGHPVKEHGPREQVFTVTYTPPEAWEQPPLRGMPPIVEEVQAL